MMNRKRAFIFAVSAFAAAALAMLPWTVESPQPLFGSPVTVLSPAFFPAAAAITVLVLAAAEFLRSGRADDAVDADAGAAPLGSGPAIVVLLVVFSSLVLESFGYVLTCILVSTTLALVMGCRAPVPLLIVCAGMPLLVDWLLREVFAIYLPMFG